MVNFRLQVIDFNYVIGLHIGTIFYQLGKPKLVPLGLT